MTGVVRAAELPRWLWLYFPPLMLIAAALAYAWAPPLYRRLFVPELGLVEIATPLVLVAGIGSGLAALRWRRALPHPLLALWIGCFTLGCLYFAGEEVSWGQHLVGWETPATIAAVNDQGETNLHNVSSWFDQKPRLLLTLWVLVGGVLAPLLRTRLVAAEDTWRAFALPTRVCLPAAALAIGVHIPKLARKTFGLEPFAIELRWSELQEYYFGLFLAFYLASIAVRLRRALNPPAATPGPLARSEAA
jgi:hypothetical protein